MHGHVSYKVSSYFTLKKIFVLIFLGLISSIILSSYYIIKYDKYRDDGHSHVMLKDETLLHWHKGAKIVEDVKNGKNFFYQATLHLQNLCLTDLLQYILCYPAMK